MIPANETSPEKRPREREAEVGSSKPSVKTRSFPESLGISLGISAFYIPAVSALMAAIGMRLNILPVALISAGLLFCALLAITKRPKTDASVV